MISEPKRTMRQATIVQKAKRRVEERLKKMKMKRDSTNEESLAGGISRRGSLENVQNENVIGETSEFVVLKERRLVNKGVIKDGMLRFGFLLEITHPGSLPDAGLMAALLDLVRLLLFFTYLSCGIHTLQTYYSITAKNSCCRKSLYSVGMFLPCTLLQSWSLATLDEVSNFPTIMCWNGWKAGRVKNKISRFTKNFWQDVLSMGRGETTLFSHSLTFEPFYCLL